MTEAGVLAEFVDDVGLTARIKRYSEALASNDEENDHSRPEESRESWIPWRRRS